MRTKSEYVLVLVSVMSSLVPVIAIAQDAAGKSMEQRINDAIAPIINPFVGLSFHHFQLSRHSLVPPFPG